MSTSVLQVRVDDEIKGKATVVFDSLGIDLPTAIRIFLKRSVLVNGIPFSMTIPSDVVLENRAILAMQNLSNSAKQNGISEMSLEEIDKEIDAVRTKRANIARSSE